jgi:DNA-binding GntR family transcriptional regulator
VSLRKSAYDSIKQGIVHHKYKPGDPLLEEHLSKELGVSRTPIREALRALQKDGLVRYIPKKGAFVAEISVRDVREVFFLRRVLETAALHVTIREYHPEDLEPLIRSFSKLDGAVEEERYDDLFQSDINLHAFIVESAGNNRLTDFMAVLNDQVERLRRVSSRTPGRMRRSLEEHRAILDAIQNRNSKLAETLLVEHLERVEQSVLAVLGY